MGASVSSAWGCMEKKPSLYASGGKVNHSLDGTKSRKKADSKIVSRSLGKNVRYGRRSFRSPAASARAIHQPNITYRHYITT